MKRIRILTLMLLVVIAALVVALVVERRRFAELDRALMRSRFDSAFLREENRMLQEQARGLVEQVLSEKRKHSARGQ